MKIIVDSKFVEFTPDEFEMYNNICASYDRPNFKGKELFVDHFESDENGIILFVKPPSKKYSSLEVYCFLVSVMNNQHLRVMHKQSSAMIEDVKKNFEAQARAMDDKFSMMQKQIDEKLNGQKETVVSKEVVAPVVPTETVESKEIAENVVESLPVEKIVKDRKRRAL